MDILNKIGQLIGVVPPQYTDQQYREYMDGWCTGYPLVGQPEYPVHESAAYRRGLRLGRKGFNKMGRPQIQYEA